METCVKSTVPDITGPASNRVVSKPSERWMLASLSVSAMLAAMGTSIANVGLPAIAHAFAASFQAVQWIVIAYLLAITTLIVSAGRLGDLVGRRRLLLAGIAVFSLGSLLCGVAPSLLLLIAARALQGVGAAIMMALSLALIGETVPKARTGSAMGLLGSMSAIGTALGPSVGGALVAGSGWHALFLVNVPLGVLAFLLANRHLPSDPQRPIAAGRHFDAIGTLLLALTLAAFALVMTLGRSQSGSLTFALLLVTAAGISAFVFFETRVASPLIPLAVFRSPGLVAGFGMSALVSTVIMATLIVGPFYLTHALSLGAAMVGLVMTVGPVAAALTGVPAGRLVDRFGAPRVTLIGLIAMLAACLVLALTPTRVGIPGYVAPMVLLTVGYALFQTSNNTTVLTHVDPDLRGVVAGMLNLSRNLGLITGASMMGAVFAVASNSTDVNIAAPQSVASGMQVTFAVAAGLIVIALATTLVGRVRGWKLSRVRRPSIETTSR
jgi:EmrB/QacA subfamily drug resistance transporter